MISSLIVSAALLACGGGGADAGADPGSDGTAARAFVAPASSDAGTSAPVVFNASRSARPGDIVSLQGENFGAVPIVWFEAVGDTPATALAVVNQVGTGWLAVQIPATATGALRLRIHNGADSSAAVALNAATPHHLDATQIVPGGAFRLFGRNLLLPGSSPSVRVDGRAATVNLAASDAHMLLVTAPTGLQAGSSAAITVDNGNGTGASTLDSRIAVVTGVSGDPFGLGVGWTAAFTALMANVINAATDTRLPSRVACNGSSDDSPAIQAALALANRTGGGVVLLPAGVCQLGGGVQLLSNTVLQGAGRDQTELRHGADSPLHSTGADVYGVRNLSITNTGSTAGASLNLKHGSRVVVQNVRVNQGDKAMAWLYDHVNVVVKDSVFEQSGVVAAPGAVHMSGNTGVVFQGNRIRFLNGTGANFDGTKDAYIGHNFWTRDASRQSEPGVVHSLTLNFARGVAVVGNDFTTTHGPVDQTKNDSETILTEGGGARRTEGLGTVASATATTFSDPSGSIHPNVLVKGAIPDNYGVAIIAGRGAGQTRRVIGFSGGTFTIDKPWTVLPDASSRYATATWGLEMAVIKGNTISQSPRGIWLYSTAVRDVDIVGNTMLESGGILVRLYQEQAKSTFQTATNLRIEGNAVRNTLGLYGSYLAASIANMDGKAVGTATYGLEVRRNTLVANPVNVAAGQVPEVGQEGYVNTMGVFGGSYDPTFAALLGTIFQGNGCTNCPHAFTLSTGAVGTVIDSSVLSNSPQLWLNQQARGTSNVRALFTQVR